MSNPERLKGRPWGNDVEISAGDVLDSFSLQKAMMGIRWISLLPDPPYAEPKDYSNVDRISARNSGMAAHHLSGWVGRSQQNVIRSFVILGNDASTGKNIEIGGSDVLTYKAMMLGYASPKD